LSEHEHEWVANFSQISWHAICEFCVSSAHLLSGGRLYGNARRVISEGEPT
jgi:hypothetical protein